MARTAAGLLDLPAPLFAGADAVLSQLPSGWRLALWGLLAGLASMLLYRLLSSQPRIAESRAAMRRARDALDRHDGDFSDARPLMRTLMGHALRQFGLTMLPTVLAAVPIAALIVWLSNAYGHTYPPASAEVMVEVEPGTLSGTWLDTPPGPRVSVADSGGGEVGVFALPAPVPVLHPQQWWNTLVANPAGYLPNGAPIERIDIGLPRQHHLRAGPAWMRGWEFPFFFALLVSALTTRWVLRIQ